MEQYDPKTIEAKWQQYWLDHKTFAAQASADKKKMYIMDMFPYPSGDGLHVGHAKIYTASDLMARYYRMKGFNVLHPMGWDAFGLPTENTAIKKGVHPAQLTKQNIARFRKQMKSLGLGYDWSREINTTDPEYYRWTQWIFLQLFQMGLAYEATIPINWCPSCKTGLANEEVIDGKCERCGTSVEEKPMRQWMLRITQYADRLLLGLEGLDWPKHIKDIQENWIGKSEGASVTFEVLDSSSQVDVFTTRVDTIFGATYVVVSPDHPLVEKVTTKAQAAAVAEYIESSKDVGGGRLADRDEDKTGVFTGGYVVHPFTNEKLPIWIANYVLMTYGTGAVMGVPAHDERDFAFATTYSLSIRQVVMSTDVEAELPYVGEGVLTNSKHWDGVPSEQAREHIVAELVEKSRGAKTTQYKLRDWVFSRQRYWGEPIPLIHCATCGVVPVPEEDLPVTLPDIDRYEPTGTGESPLAAVSDWVNVTCPSCSGPGKRETNTMPQWAGSSWYWLRYVSPQYAEGVARKEDMKAWLPVDLYLGGAEHAVLHLLYARFWQKALFDQGVVFDEEPFNCFKAVGLILGEDNQKMSKSRGNVVNPDDVVAEYGADTLRMYEMFVGPFEASVPWDTKGIKGARRFLDRVWNFVGKHQDARSMVEDDNLELLLHKMIKRVSEGIEELKFNTGVAAMMEWLNEAEKKEAVARSTVDNLLKLLAPFAPHMAEELWSRLGHKDSIAEAAWPEVDDALLNRARVKVVVQVNGKVRGEIEVDPGLPQAAIEGLAREVRNVAKYLEGVDVMKVIYVPNRLLNFVVKPAS